jgi:predicted ATPase
LTEANLPLVTLTGPGGVGKTRLAFEVAAVVRSSYADGIVTVHLATVTDPANVLPAIAQALDLAEARGQSIGEVVISALRPRQTLLLLDNLEHVLGVAPTLAELLAACPALQMLVTSRSRLHIRDEREVTIFPLSLPSRAAR